MNKKNISNKKNFFQNYGHFKISHLRFVGVQDVMSVPKCTSYPLLSTYALLQVYMYQKYTYKQSANIRVLYSYTGKYNIDEV